MGLERMIRDIDLFHDLSQVEVREISALCRERVLQSGDYLVRQGEYGDEMFILTEGFVEVLLERRGDTPPRVLITLGPGQTTGEMALLDLGPRSASVRAVSTPTVVQAIQRAEFKALCEKNTQIGYKVMRNLALDLVFKLRHRNLLDG
ncbi:MAG TPA: cyclic nucleotide-binding domain-containing protein [Anaerolineales bacterium]|nr:cyclic nucleotide-binding domain-containing protein [Anaerolineales bacterium]